MEQTYNYGFNKPELSDPANITQLNYNWDEIDTLLEVDEYNLAMHMADQNNPHNVTKEQLGIDLSEFEEHIQNKNNPHNVTKEQLGIDLSAYDEHLKDKNNPHDVTAAQANAVSKNGDTVNGDLTVKGAFVVEDNPIKATNGVTTVEIQGGVNGTNENGHHFLDINLDGKVGYGRLRLNLEDAGKMLSAKELLYLVTQDNTKGDEQHWYRVFHEGSKPSGSYGGTNTAKTINTGGIGNVLIIRCTNYVTIITPVGGFAMGTENTGKDGAYFHNEVKYANGNLIISRVYDETLAPHRLGGINKPGVTYTYQCL